MLWLLCTLAIAFGVQNELQLAVQGFAEPLHRAESVKRKALHITHMIYTYNVHR